MASSATRSPCNHRVGVELDALTDLRRSGIQGYKVHEADLIDSTQIRFGGISEEGKDLNHKNIG